MADSQVRLDRVTLTKEQLRATELTLYKMADLIDRLLADRDPLTGQGVQYTKQVVPYPQTAPVAGQLPAAPTQTAEQIAPRSPNVLRGG